MSCCVSEKKCGDADKVGMGWQKSLYGAATHQKITDQKVN